MLDAASHAPSRGQIFWPALNPASPCAVQQGVVTESNFTVTYAETGAYQVLVGGRGVAGEIVSPAAPGVVAAPMAPTVPGAKPANRNPKIKVRFKVAADAPLGIREVRLLTPNGPSSVGQIVVVHDPIVPEKNPNGSMQQAQAISWPATLVGAIEAREDVDFFKFKVAAGTALTFHVYCQRLQNKLTMVTTGAAPLLALRNSAGTVLASNDSFFGGDSLLHYRFQTAGEYYLEIRDVAYLAGNAAWEYAIEVHDRPFVTAVSPACLPPTTPTKVRLIGYNLPADPFVTLTLPADAPAMAHWQPLPDLEGKSLNAALVQACPLPVVHGYTPAAAAADRHRGRGGRTRTCRRSRLLCLRRQKRRTFHLRNRRAPAAIGAGFGRAALDSLGEVLIENDDASDKTGYLDKRNEMVSPDSRIEDWAAPADGRYVLEVSDGQGRGGARFNYSLLARRSGPHFHLELSTDRTVVAPGGAGGVIFVRSVRKEGFTGDIRLTVEGLPKGVTAVCGSVPAACQDGCILLRADGDAKPRTFGAIRVVGTAALADGPEATKQTAVARPFGELTQQGGARVLVPVDEHVVSVVEPLDLKAVRCSLSEIRIKPVETKTI